MGKEYFNYFSDRERPSVRKFEAYRTGLFAPLCAALANHGISPDMVSLFGLAFLVPAAGLFESHPGLVILSLVLYVLMDGIDGSLARLTGKCSQAGALLDIVCDQAGMVVVTALYAHHGYLDGGLGCWYVAAYLAMIALSVFQNRLGVAMQTIFRSKYYLYAFYPVVMYTRWWRLLPYAVGIFAVLHTVSAGQSLWRIRAFYQRRDEGDGGAS